MRYIVKTFGGTKDLEDYLNKLEVDVVDIKITINHSMILLVVICN